MTDLIENALRQIIRDEVEKLNAVKQPQQVEDKKEKLYTTSEACELLRCSKPTLIRWKRDGHIPFVRIGGSIRYRESDILKVLESKR